MPKVKTPKELMTINNYKLIDFVVFDDKYILGVYEGSLSDYDILIKYREKIDGIWSRVRTPKHIHWTVDILIKLNEAEKETQKFIKLLINLWNETKPLKNNKQRNLVIKNFCPNRNLCKELNNKGIYSIQFLYELARLLMIQEKTNMNEAFMFINLLKRLYENKDLFRIISASTHR